MRNITISIHGSVGAGKTTLLEKLPVDFKIGVDEFSIARVFEPLPPYTYVDSDGVYHDWSILLMILDNATMSGEA